MKILTNSEYRKIAQNYAKNHPNAQFLEQLYYMDFSDGWGSSTLFVRLCADLDVKHNNVSSANTALMDEILYFQYTTEAYPNNNKYPFSEEEYEIILEIDCQFKNGATHHFWKGLTEADAFRFKQEHKPMAHISPSYFKFEFCRYRGGDYIVICLKE